jgi:hypothetical protein
VLFAAALSCWPCLSGWLVVWLLAGWLAAYLQACNAAEAARDINDTMSIID